MSEILEIDGLPDVTTDPASSAASAGLHYVRDDQPGFYRKPWGKGFTYVDERGQTVKEEKLRERFDALVIPPAWTDVWICRSPRGHIQATGRDEKGRKQYIYHPKWEEARNETKFNRMVAFGEALAGIRERCESDLRKRGLSRDKVLAAAVRLLDETLIRVGNPEYARDNQSYGLTTLRDRHVDFDGSTCTFTFKGKSGKEHSIELNDRRLARIVRDCRDIPGYQLFQYYGEGGVRNCISSQDVNAYLKDTTGQDFTAKDFRTWGGSVQAAVILDELGEAEDEKAAGKNVVQMIKRVSERLGNTTTVCRQYYVHPALVKAYTEGNLLEQWRRCLEGEQRTHLVPEENALLVFLQEHRSAN